MVHAICHAPRSPRKRRSRRLSRGGPALRQDHRVIITSSSLQSLQATREISTGSQVPLRADLRRTPPACRGARSDSGPESRLPDGPEPGGSPPFNRKDLAALYAARSTSPQASSRMSAAGPGTAPGRRQRPGFQQNQVVCPRQRESWEPPTCVVQFGKLLQLSWSRRSRGLYALAGSAAVSPINTMLVRKCSWNHWLQSAHQR
jgi:hypothetical protein